MSWEATKWARDQRVGDGPNVSAGCAKGVLMVLAEAADAQAQCWPSQATIADRAEISERAVSRALDHLEQQGSIRRTRRTDSRGQRTSDLITLAMGRQPARVAGREGPTNPSACQVGERAPTCHPVHAYLPSCPSLPARVAEEVVIEPIKEPIREPPIGPPSRSNRKTGASANSRQKLRTPLPDNFPDEDAKARMVERFAKAGLPVDVEVEVERFRNHHEAKGTLSASWPGTWATWTLNGIRFAQERAERAQGPKQVDWC